ncbi:MAG: Lrp/AsnC family transcriptional regulator [Candidatus Bathyarchaeota archaeon]|nr:Lrp/AsnC family transcriptional regulator [Candidatus Bathyarchaeota archaeon]
MSDDVTARVLEEYLRDSRQSIREVARKVGVSSGTVASRLKEMEDTGIIRRYSAILDYEKLGYELTAITEVTVSDGKMIEACETIAKMGQATGVYNVTGDADIMVVGKFRSRKELSDFTKKLLIIPHVLRTKTHLVLNTMKEDFSLIP